MPRIRKRVLALGGLTGAGLLSALRRRASRPVPPAPSPEAPPAPDTPPAATVSAPVAATPPVEAPGPSVTPPGRGRPEPEPPAPGDDPLVDLETAAAAAEAGAIGGPSAHDAPDGDPAMDPVYQAGGGESEGFELAEADLIENASHGDGRGDPARDAMRPEVEADEVTGVAGEADEERAPDGAGTRGRPRAG